MSSVRGRAPWAGLLAALVLVGAAFTLPQVFDWEVFPRAPRSASDREIPPLHGLWEPKLLGPGTLPALVLALLAWRYAGQLAAGLSWRPLLVVSYAAGLAWLLVLALVDGTEGLSRVLGSRFEYLPSAREVDDVSALLHGYVDRIPMDAPDNWPTHPAGHPPGMLLLFVGLVRVGLGGDLVAGVVVTVVAATIPLAVLTTMRGLGAEAAARRAAPFLVLAPAAVFLAVSADALIAAVMAWGLAALSVAVTATGRRAAGWAALAGLLLGYGVLMSYGMPLMGVVALAVLLAGSRQARPALVVLLVAAASALAVVLAFAAAGFAWWEAFPVLRERYWDGIAADRPGDYWTWANLAAITVSAGPLVGAALAQLVVAGPRALRSPERPVVLLAVATVLVVVAADLSQMSRAEVERIWLPFIPWLTVATALLSSAWRRWGLALQLAWALVVQHLLYTSW